MYVPSVYDQNQESWGLLVKEFFAYTGKLKTPLFWSVSMVFCVVLGCVELAGLCYRLVPDPESLNNK